MKFNHKPLTKMNEKAIQDKSSALLKQMTRLEKIGQLHQAAYFSKVITGHKRDTSQTVEQIRSGLVGSVLSVRDETALYQLQKTAVEESRLGIPLLFCFDVIHGFKTAFPINLALSSSWDPELIERISKAVAYETTHGGIHLVFSPMVDLVRDPRWGRVMESNGEDPYLSGELAKAYVKGYQQDDLSNKHAVAACVKHFAAYGFVEAGREYNTVDLSERVLRTMVLPPFQATIDAGVAMLMTGFTTLFDRPATANTWLLKNMLRDEMGFKGVTISDYTSTEEIIHHKVAKDEKDAAMQCFNAGLDHEMVSQTYIKHLDALIEENKVDETDLDEAVRRILQLKIRLGLFDDPYRNLYENSQQYMLLDETRNLSKEAAEKSVVMLKNDAALPLKSNEKIALIGPFIDNQDVIGEWAGLTEKSDVVTILDAFKNQHARFTYFEPDTDLKALNDYDKVIIALGESGPEAGEGNSKTDIHIQASQRQLFDSVRQHNDNVVLIVFAGRPLIMTHFDQAAKAMLYAYQPGTETGSALYNLLYGKTSPSAKLTMTFPQHQGQIPIYYNHYQTGRPFDKARPNYRYNTRYRDCDNEPLYPFGHGLSYGRFVYKNLSINKAELKPDETLDVSVDITNEGLMSATEIVQCYIEAMHYSVTRPVNELKAFKKITIKSGETQTVNFKLTVNDFKSFNHAMHFTAETRPYKVKVGTASNQTMTCTIDVKDK